MTTLGVQLMHLTKPVVKCRVKGSSAEIVVYVGMHEVSGGRNIRYQLFVNYSELDCLDN